MVYKDLYMFNVNKKSRKANGALKSNKEGKNSYDNKNESKGSSKSFILWNRAICLKSFNHSQIIIKKKMNEKQVKRKLLIFKGEVRIETPILRSKIPRLSKR